jgi:hypothetical protein
MRNTDRVRDVIDAVLERRHDRSRRRTRSWLFLNEDPMTRDKLYSVPDLKDRGWTATAIKQFLPSEPDDTRDNPRYAHAGAPMKFWHRTRVHRVEKTKRFQSWKEGTDARKQRARRGVETRVDNMVQKMSNARITIKRGLTTEQVWDLAERTHGGNYQGDPGPFRRSNRAAKNCVRHCLTNYEELWAICNRDQTGREGYEVLRERVDDLIDEAYPQFAGPDEEQGPMS